MTHVVGLRLHNYQCFRGLHELDLGPGVYAVTAEAADNAERSNYLGKSALLGALRYALEGHKPKDFDSLDALISLGEPEMGVDVELSDGTFVSRTKKRGRPTQLKVVITTPDPQSEDGRELELFGDEGERRVWSLLGLSADDLEMTAYAEQGQLAALVSPSSKVDIGAVVNGWLDLGKLEAASDAAGVELRNLVSRLRAAETALLQVQESLQGNSSDSLAERVAELRALAEVDTMRRQEHSQRLTEHDAWLRLKERREHAQAAHDEARRLEAELPAPVVSDPKLIEAGAVAARRLNEAEIEYRQKRTLATGRFGGACPVNAKPCPIADQINADQAGNARLLEHATTRRAAAFTENAAAQNALSNQDHAAREHARAFAYLQRARDEAAKLAPLLEQPLPPEPETVDFVAGVAVAIDLQAAVLAHNLAKAAEQRQAALLDDVLQLKQQVAAARAGFAVIGPEGAQRRCAERAVQEVERTANTDLAHAGIDLTVRFAWGRETQVPAVQCPQCGAAFPRSTAIKKCESCLAPRGMKVDPTPRFVLSRVSGAAKDLVGLAVRCAAFKWLRARRGASWSVAVLDEPFGALDRYHRRALSAHVQSLLASTFTQAFVVAHDAQILDSMPRRIVIRGDGRWSSVRVA